MKIVITGAKGMLAHAVIDSLKNENELICTDVDDLDITNEEKTVKFIEENKPDATVLIAGHGALNKALFLHLLHKQLKDFWSGVYQGNCAVNKFEIKNGNVRLIEEAKYY